MLQAVITPVGPYRLQLMCRSGQWSTPLPGGRVAHAWQQPHGDVVVRVASVDDLARARFMLALDDDTTAFHERFANDPLLGPTSRAFVGYRPLRVATVAHAALRAFCGQLVQSSRARQIERAVLRACGAPVATQHALGQLPPAELRRCGLAASRASAIVRLCRGLDLERLRDHPSDAVRALLARERGIGPWTIGVIAVRGLGRYDLGIVGDLELVKLASSLEGRWVDVRATAELLAPYGSWQGLAAELLLLGWARGLVPGAGRDAARALPRSGARAA